MRYTDATRTALDDTCPKARYWGYEYRGRGVTPIAVAPELTFGLAIAKGVEQIRLGHAISMPSTPTDRATTDAEVLQAALLVAYAARIWPQWLTEYRVLGTEVECAIPLDTTVTYLARPDAVLERRSDQTVWILSDKTTSLATTHFVTVWDHAVQNHAECLAVEQWLGRAVTGYLVQGWSKGTWRQNQLCSPLCYGWRKESPFAVRVEWSPTVKQGWGWRRCRVDSYEPGGIAGWLASLAPDVVQHQFPLAGPIAFDRGMTAQYLKQVASREHHILQGGTEEDAIYPQRFSQCDEFGKYRRPCAFRDCCWAPTIGRDPVGSTLYHLREPHHVPEQAALKDREHVITHTGLKLFER